METIETPAVEANETVETVAAPATTNPFKERTKSWTPQQMAHWRATGDEPETTSSAATDASAEQAETSTEEVGTVETEAASAPARDNEDKPKRGSYKELRERAARAEARAELLEQQLKTPASKEEPKPEVKRTIEKAPDFPDLNAFKTIDEYNAAVKKWREDDRLFTEQEVERKFQERDQRASAEAENSKWTQQVDAQKKAHTDYEMVAFNKNVPVSDAILAVIKRHPKGAELLYAAGKNVAETVRIAELTNVRDLATLAKSNPARAAYLYGKAETLAELELEKLLTKKVTPQTRTVPKPTGEVAVNGRSGTVEKLDDDQLLKMGRITSGEWKRRANARDMAERRGA